MRNRSNELRQIAQPTKWIELLVGISCFRNVICYNIIYTLTSTANHHDDISQLTFESLRGGEASIRDDCDVCPIHVECDKVKALDDCRLHKSRHLLELFHVLFRGGIFSRRDQMDGCADIQYNVNTYILG